MADLPTDYAANDAGHVDAHDATNTRVNANTALLATALQAGSNLSDLADVSTARTNLGLGDAATHAASDFDAFGAASTAQTAAETFATETCAPLPSGTPTTGQVPSVTQVSPLTLGWASAASSVSEVAMFSASTATVTASVGYQLESDGALSSARMSCTGAPVGSDLVCEVQWSSDGGVSWTTVSTLTIPAGTTTAVTATLSQAVSAGDLVRVNCTSAGSTTAAVGVAVQVVSS